MKGGDNKGSIFAACLGVVLVIMAWSSFDYGPTWDEELHAKHAVASAKYYLSGFQKADPAFYSDNCHLYGDLYEFTALAVYHAVPGLDMFQARHLTASVFGWLAIVFAALLARRLFGFEAGMLTMVFLLVSPRFFGHSMNNPKDIPFAAGYTLGLYALSFARASYPFVTKKQAAGIILGVAMALNIRAGGLLLVAYAGLLFGILFLKDRNNYNMGRIARFAGVFMVCAVVAVLLGSVLWPWALLRPIYGPIEALSSLSRGHQSGFMLFNGQWVDLEISRWDYYPRWFAITTPLAVLAGGLASPLLLFWKKTRPYAAGLLFAVIFPVAWVIYSKAVVYNGIRHMLFIYPAMAVLAAGTAVWLIKQCEKWKYIQGILAFVIIVGGLYDSTRFSLANHPNQVVYFNQLTGGMQGAFMNYDLDYWGNSYKQGVDWVAAQAALENKTLTICAGGVRRLAELNTMEHDNVRYAPTCDEADYYMIYTNLLPKHIQSMTMRKNEVHRVEADNVPLLVILKVGERKEYL